MGLVGLAATVSPQQQQPTFRGGARFVRVDVYPTDSAGKPIEGLTTADFELFEDGKPQAIDTFQFVRIEPEPEVARVDPNSQQEGETLAKDPRARVFAIVLDTRHVDIASGRGLRAPLTGMLDRLLGPRDMVGIITPELPVSSFLLGRKTTTAADMLARHWTWGTYDNIIPQDPIERLFDGCLGPVTGRQSGSMTRELVARHRERETLDHLSALIDKLQDIREERKVVIVVTQGWRLFEPNESAARQVGAALGQSMPQIGQRGGQVRTRMTEADRTGYVDDTACLAEANALFMRDSRRPFRDLMDKAARANVAFYPVDPRGLAVFDQPISHGVIAPTEELARITNRAEGLRALAMNTEGIALLNNNDLDTQFRILTDALSAYYLLGYYSTNTKFDGRYRRLEVKVKRPGVLVKARRGYFAPTEEEMAALAEGREAASKPPTEDAAALAGALGRLAALTHNRDLFVQAARVDGALVVNAEIGVSARVSPAWAEGGDVRMTIVTAGGAIVETRPIAPTRSGASLRVAIQDPGAIRIDVRSRARGTGASSASEASLMVPPMAPSPLGEPLSYRGIARALMPAADGRYRRTERATVEATLATGAAPAGARVLDKAGRPLNVPITARERLDATGTRWMVAELVLAPLTDGEYLIELEAMKDAAREKKLLAIRVVR